MDIEKKDKKKEKLRMDHDCLSKSSGYHPLSMRCHTTLQKSY